MLDANVMYIFGVLDLDLEKVFWIKVSSVVRSSCPLNLTHTPRPNPPENLVVNHMSTLGCPQAWIKFAMKPFSSS